MGFGYNLALACFAIGLLTAGRKSRTLRSVGWLSLAQVPINLAWPPMHLRGEPMSMTDTLHIVFAVITVALFLTTLALGSRAMGKAFRIYTLLTLAVVVFFGVLTGIEGPLVAANAATPYLGIFERINIAAYFQWVLVLSIGLLRTVGGRRISDATA
jgi:hypothetical protein